MTNWRHKAACRGLDGELFFPVAGEATAIFEAQVAEAKAVCARCPVRAECLAEALETPNTVGVWGGTTDGERAALRRRIVRVGAQSA
jgi:WhiB family redox-sensing transcriptional regulator